jgi:hypothetical protein
MASKSEATASRVIVIDTSYLLDLYGIPGSSKSNKVDQEAQDEITQRFENAIHNKDLLFVPLPCIFEVGNHIAKAYKKDQRKLAELFLTLIDSSVKEGVPWVITPTKDDIKFLLDEFLLELFKTFATEYAGKNIKKEGKRESIGLTDAFIIAEANRLKDKFQGRQVHIWTKEELLKDYEPDTEENPYPP